MKKKSFKNLAVLGLSSGLLVMQTLSAQAETKESSKTASVKANDDAGNLGYHLMTEAELADELNDDGYKLFKSLSPEGKAIALEIASARCNGMNECKGRNACKTDKNECAGKGACKGQGKCAVSDKNLAVKLAADVMAAKRSESLNK